jgi:hypothetical protein
LTIITWKLKKYNRIGILQVHQIVQPIQAKQKSFSW